MKQKWFKTWAVVLTLAVMAAIAMSQTEHGARMRGDGMPGGEMFGGGMPGGPRLDFYMHKLDLTEAQQAQLKAVMEKEKPAFRPLMLQMAQSHAQLRDLIINGGFDEAKVREMAAQQSQTMTELTVQYARVGSEMVQILTPEQKTKLTQLISEHDQRMMNHMQKAPEGTQNQ